MSSLKNARLQLHQLGETLTNKLKSEFLVSHTGSHWPAAGAHTKGNQSRTPCSFILIGINEIWGNFTPEFLQQLHLISFMFQSAIIHFGRILLKLEGLMNSMNQVGPPDTILVFLPKFFIEQTCACVLDKWVYTTQSLHTISSGFKCNCFESHMHRNIKNNVSRSDYAVSI